MQFYKFDLNIHDLFFFARGLGPKYHETNKKKVVVQSFRVDLSRAEMKLNS